MFIKTTSIKIAFNYPKYWLLLVALFSITACSGKKEHTPEKAETSNFQITQTQFEATQMTLGEINNHGFQKSVSCTGMFDVPPENQAAVSVYFGGYVKDLNLLMGQKVKKGQALFTLENPDYIQIQQDYLETQKRLDYLKLDYDRQSNLFQDKVASQKVYLKAKADYEVAQVHSLALEKKLRLMGINVDRLNKNTIQSTIIISAPIEGYITSINAKNGMFLNPNDVAVDITDTDHLHVELNIFEKDLAWVHVGQAIKFHIQDDTNRVYDAKVYLINPHIDEDKRMASVHAHLLDESSPNPFVPGMYIQAEIIVSSEEKPALPKEAVVNIDDENFVLVKEQDKNGMIEFAKKQVELGQSSEDYVEILNYADFPKGTQILTKYASNLLQNTASESF